MPADDVGFSAAITNIQQQIATLTKGFHACMDEMADENRRS